MPTPLPLELITSLCTEAAAPADILTVEALADLWLADHMEDDGDPDDLAWSDLCVFELDAHPEVLFAFCLRAIRKATNAWQVGLVAAGPLEELLTTNGAQFIDQIEDQARRSERIRYMLTGVWTQDLPDSDIRNRIEAARAVMMDRGLESGSPLPPA